MDWTFCFFQVQFPWGCHMSPQNGPLLPWEQCVKYWTKAPFRSCHWRAEPRVKFCFGFLHVASLLTLAHTFGEYRLQTSSHPIPFHTNHSSVLKLLSRYACMVNLLVSWGKCFAGGACLETHFLQSTWGHLNNHCSHHPMEGGCFHFMSRNLYLDLELEGSLKTILWSSFLMFYSSWQYYCLVVTLFCLNSTPYDIYYNFKQSHFDWKYIAQELGGRITFLE